MTEEPKPLVPEIFDGPRSDFGRDQPLRAEVLGDPRPTGIDVGAISALVFAILSFFPFPVLGSIVALVTAHQAKGRIRASDGRLQGYSLARWAQGLAVVSLLLGALLLWLIWKLVSWAFGAVGF